MATDPTRPEDARPPTQAPGFSFLGRFHVGPGATRLVALVFVAVTFAAIGYATAAASAKQPTIPPIASDRPDSVRGVVQSLTPSLTLTTSAGPRQLTLTDATRFEALRPASLADARAGDWINGGGVGHQQTFYALTGLVIIPAANLASKR